MQVVENSIDIERPPAEVFDYCSDMRTEADWNPVAGGVTLASAEPVGVGSRFVCDFSGYGRSTTEIVEFLRPTTWTTRTVEAKLPFRLVGTVAERPGGTSRLTMRIELRPAGAMALLGPVIKMMMARTARENMTRIKAAVEQRPT